MRRLVMTALLGSSLAAAVGTAGAASPSEPTWPTCIPRSTPITIGIKQVSRTKHGRLETLRLFSRAMGNVQPVDVLLPRRYDASGRTRYHILYLLHGAGGDYRSWIETGVQRLIGSLPVITVMPNGTQDGIDGDYTDWVLTAPGAPQPAPAWESYHISELVPFIDSHFPTVASAAGRAIAGISMGGGGATKYAAEYPGTFGYVGTFSGESHPLLPVALAFQSKNCRWGSPGTDQVIWRDNDSTDLAGNLRGVRVFIRTGTGLPGPFDAPTPPVDPAQAAVRQVQLLIEFGAHLENESFLRALRVAGVRTVDAQFFPGSHSLPYWQRDAREFAAWLARQFRHPPRPPASIAVSSAHGVFSAWGWRFHVHRRVREFIYLRLTHNRIWATGSGSLDVQTPSSFRPRGRYRLRIDAKTTVMIRADASGALRFRLGLGPSHVHQQTQFSPSARRRWRTVSTTVSAG